MFGWFRGARAHKPPPQHRPAPPVHHGKMQHNPITAAHRRRAVIAGELASEDAVFGGGHGGGGHGHGGGGHGHMGHGGFRGYGGFLSSYPAVYDDIEETEIVGVIDTPEGTVAVPTTIVHRRAPWGLVG